MIVLIFLLSQTDILRAGTTHNEKVTEIRSPGKTPGASKKRAGTNPFATKLNTHDGEWFMALDREARLSVVRRSYNRERHRINGLMPPEVYVGRLEEFYTAFDMSMRRVKVEEALLRMMKKDAT